MGWTNESKAKLTVKDALEPSNYFSFEGVNGGTIAGSPQNFVDAANHLLNIAGLSATITGITRTVKQGELLGQGGYPQWIPSW